MRNKFKLSFKLSLLVLVFIPFVGFVITVMLQINRNNSDIITVNKQILNSDFVYSNSELMTLIQIERGLTANYINGNGTKDKIDSARENVTIHFKETKKALELSTLFKKVNTDFNLQLDELNKTRSKVDSKTLTSITLLEEYTKIISSFTKFNSIAVNEKTAGGVGKRLTSLNALIEIQESIGRFRGYASSVIAKDEPITRDVMEQIDSDFNSIALGIRGSGILLTSESIKIKELFLNSKELSQSKEDYKGIYLNYQSGNYNLDSNRIWSNTTKLIEYIQEIISNEFNFVSNLNKTLIKGYTKTKTTTIIIISLTSLAIAILSIIIGNFIIQRINKVTDRLIKMSEGGGDLTNLLEQDIDDEIGKLSSAFNAYIISLSTLISGIKKMGSNFVNFSSQLNSIINDANSSNTKVSISLNSVESNIKNEKISIIAMKDEMNKVQSYTSMLQNDVDEQMTAVEESSAAVEQMIANIRTVTNNVEKTATIVSDLSITGNEGRNQINRVSQEIATVFELSNSLKNANNLIADIADRTSLLSMNAAIEAAHAGDAGKGFAVVADEIRKLSESTSSQSKGISENLKSIIAAISTAVQSTKETEATFTKISNKIDTVANNQGQIKSAMTEQNQGSAEILDAMSMLKSNSYSVETTVSDLNSATQNMQNEEEKVFDIIKSVSEAVNIMTNAMNEVNEKLLTLTSKEEVNNKLVKTLSNSMEKFIVN
ncbi:MAG: nitrate- and nitrite sensing domain-containing protein [Spirochaetales bacterium]|nr:nitrate- and nitrite sensing domain-containing protein [Spirochaetales bacterium]